jgi:hypothetical protein
MSGKNSGYRWIATSVKPNRRYGDIFFINEKFEWIDGDKKA